MRPVQLFSKEYLELCRQMTPLQIARFLEDFRLIHANSKTHPKSTKSKLISMKVEENLLGAFRVQCDLLSIPYQTQVKKLMREWLDKKK